MPRFVITDPFPVRPASIASDVLVIAPHSGVARALGVPTRNLQSMAKDTLKRNGFGIATPIRASNVLNHAVRDIVSYPDDASAMARRNRETVGAILRSGIDTAKIIANGSTSAILAARIAARYSDLLAADHLIDSEAALSAALKLEVVKPQKLLIYGYFRARQLRARPEEIEFIDRLAADNSIFYLPIFDAPIFDSNREWMELLTSRGWVRQEQASYAPDFHGGKLASAFAAGVGSNNTEGLTAIKYPDLESEVRGTLACAKAAALSGVRPGSIAIVCRDLGLYSKLLIANAREYRVPIDIDCDVPIAETPFGEFISLIFDTLEQREQTEISAGATKGREGFQYEPTLRLMLHRFGPGLTEQQRSDAYAKRPDNVENWRSITDQIEKLETAGEMAASKWSAWLRRLLYHWDLRGKEKLGSSATDVVAFDNFFDSLEQLASERDSSPISIEAFSADVGDVLANIKTPMHTESGGIKVLQPNAVVGSEFQRIFLVGMAEGILPTPSSDSNVIDYFEREKLRRFGIHFENALEVPRWEALSFYCTLLACRGDIVFSYPQFASDSEQLESSYFKRMGIKPKKPLENFVSGVEEYRRVYLSREDRDNGDSVFPLARHQLAIEQRRESDLSHDEYDGITRLPARRSYWSATSLSKIGACPFRWFASEVLRLDEPAEADSDLPPDIRGRLYHRTLELAVNRAKDSDDIRAATIAALEEEFTKAEVEELAVSLVANWQLRRSEHLEQLRFAVAAKKFFNDGAKIAGTELSFVSEIGGLTIKGKIDRVDRLNDGTLQPIDYKTGGYVAKIKDENGDLTIDIQMPIYSLVGMPTLFPGEAVTTGTYFNLTKGERVKGNDIAVEPILNKFQSMLKEGRFPVDPDNKRNACTYCEFDIVCRSGARLERKPDK